MAEAVVIDGGSAAAADGGSGATGRGGCSTSCSRCSWRCCSCSPGALVLLDTAPGHRFIVDRIGGLETASGLNIRIGRIDGSIFGKSQLQQRRGRRQRGVFLTSPNIKLDWAPGAWLYNKLYDRQPDRRAGRR